MITHKNASKELFDLRCKYGKTQIDIASGSGVSRVTINRIENNHLKSDVLRADTFFKLNEYFKTLGEI